jgi:hypothetical protein
MILTIALNIEGCFEWSDTDKKVHKFLPSTDIGTVNGQVIHFVDFYVGM